MAADNLTNSLLTEHLRYTPLTLVDEIINIVNEVLYRTITAVETGLLSAGPSVLGFEDARREAAKQGLPPPAESAAAQTAGSSLSSDPSQHHPDLADYPEAKAEIENGVHQLETFLESTVDRNFDKVEIYVLRNILTVPAELAQWVRLKHYEGLSFSQDGKLDLENLYRLRRKVRETERLAAALKAERQRGEQQLIEVRQLVKEELGWLTQGDAVRKIGMEIRTAKKDGKPLTERTRKAVAALPELKRLLHVLKPRSDGITVGGSTEVEGERRLYIEGQAKKALEQQGADVRTGDGLVGRGGGRMMGSVVKEDVEAIEGIVGALDDKRRESNN